MAMIHQNTCDLLAFAWNGANRPLHQDRQVLRAEDLALEQASQDAMLARARRYLHGWGVVAGFVPEVTKSMQLDIGPGYGVTPLGDELFLPEPVSLPEAAEMALQCCGPGPLGCEEIDPDALATARASAEEITVDAWLIARPASRDAAPRPGVPEGCAHPAATLLPSRRCGGVEFAILCDLPPSHQPPAPDCAVLTPFVCGVRGTHPPLPWPAPLGPDANFLVIAQLTVTRSTLTAKVGARRTLWPVALIQDWISACLCTTIQPPPTAPVAPPPPTPPVREPAEPPSVRPPTFPPGIVAPEPPLVIEPVTPPMVEPPIIPPVIVAPEPLPVHPPVLEPVPPPVVQPPIIPPVVVAPGPLPELPPVVAPEPPPLVEPVSPPIAPPGVVTPDVAAPGVAPGAASLPAGLTGSVTGISGIGGARAAALAGIGVTTEGAFLATPTAELAAAMNLPMARVTAMKQAIRAKHNIAAPSG